MSRVRTILPLAAALLAVLASVLVAPRAQADTTTTSSTSTTTSTSTPAPSSTPSSTSTTTTSTSTSTSTTTPAAAPTSTSPGSTAPSLSSAHTIAEATSGVPLFIAAGTPAPPPVGTPSQTPAGPLIELTAPVELAEFVSAPSAELMSTIEHFFDQGGATAYLWLTSDEQASTLISATTQIAAAGTSADLFVIPGLAALDGQEYLDVAAALAALAHGQLGLALLDPPSTVVAAVQAAWRDASALVTLAGQLRTSVAVLDSAALYAAPLVDLDTGETVPASVVMAGMLNRQDENAGVWTPAAGTKITAIGLDVLLPVTNVQLATFGLDVNAFRDLPNYGTVMWGDRTLDTDSSDYRYISVDRTADWIHRSISQSVGWAVFEPNEQAAQVAVETPVSAFLTELWKQGALVGATPSQGFQLTFGLEPPPDLWGVGEGLWLHVGLALVEPAELQSFDLLVPTASS